MNLLLVEQLRVISLCLSNSSCWFGKLFLGDEVYTGSLLLPVGSFSDQCLFWTVVNDSPHCCLVTSPSNSFLFCTQQCHSEQLPVALVSRQRYRLHNPAGVHLVMELLLLLQEVNHSGVCDWQIYDPKMTPVLTLIKLMYLLNSQKVYTLVRRVCGRYHILIITRMKISVSPVLCRLSQEEPTLSDVLSVWMDGSPSLDMLSFSRCCRILAEYN